MMMNNRSIRDLELEMESMRRRHTYRGILAAFLGGAALGAAAVAASHPPTRRWIRDTADLARRRMKRVPAALRDARDAAGESLRGTFAGNGT